MNENEIKLKCQSCQWFLNRNPKYGNACIDRGKIKWDKPCRYFTLPDPIPGPLGQIQEALFQIDRSSVDESLKVLNWLVQSFKKTVLLEQQTGFRINQRVIVQTANGQQAYATVRDFSQDRELGKVVLRVHVKTDDGVSIACLLTSVQPL